MTQQERNLTRIVKRYGFAHVERDTDKQCWRIYKHCGNEHGYGHRTQRALYAELVAMDGYVICRGTPLWQEQRKLRTA